MQIDKLQNDKRQNVKYSKKTKIINEANFESSAGLQLFSTSAYEISCKPKDFIDK